MTVQTPGNPAAQPNEGGAPRDGDNQQQGSTETSRNATDDAARNGQSDGEDDLDSESDPARLRDIIRELRKGERRRNEGYNQQRTQLTEAQRRLQEIERERQQSAPLEDRVRTLEQQLTERDQKIERMEKERKTERTDAGIMAAARRLNAADPDDVVRLLDRDELQTEDDGTPTNAEQVVRALLKKKPHLLRTSASGGADGGNRGESGKGDGSDMNDLIRGARRSRVSPGG